MALEFDSTNRRPGYRLHRLELYNWGTFDSSGGQVYRFEPCGRTALMVGHNGSGKSTLVDALLTLLVVSGKRSYNVAAGAKSSERNEESYIRGAVGRTSDDSQFTVVKYLRDRGSSYSAISAVFRDETLDRAFTLCVILHLTANGTDKVFALADEDRELRDDLDGLRSSDAIRSHFDALGYRTTKTFSEYHGWLTRRTGMRPKAMDLFNQTVSVKDIQSLNDFIRKRMLEAHDWREKVDRLLTHFNDLSIAHQELVRARRSQELLIPVERHGIRYREQALELTELENMRDAADSFFACETVRLFTPEIERLSGELEAVVGQKERLGDEISQAEQRKWELSNEIKQAGGDRLQRIPDLIKIETEQLKRKQEAFQRFHTQLRQAGIDRGVGTADELIRVRSELLTIQTDSTTRLESASEMYEAAISERGTLRKELRAREEELAILNERRTNLPPNLATLRERLCADLDLDESKLLFASELMAVKDEERQWEASVELVLNPFARTLLVQDQFYRRVRNYIETNRLTDRSGAGQRLEYTRVGRGPSSGGDRIHPRSLYHKLTFRDHNLTSWVTATLLHRFDYRCCDTVKEFDECDMAITVNRHIKRGRDHHIKDDRKRAVDPLSFILGWDNHDKKRRLNERVQELKAEERRFDATIKGHSETVTLLRRRLEAVEDALALHDFDAIDVQRHQQEIADLEEEKAQLESDNEVVQALKKRLTETEELLATLKVDRDEFVREEDRLSKFIKQGELAIANANRDVDAARSNGDLERHEPFFDAIRGSLSDLNGGEKT